MSLLAYRDQTLYFEDVALPALAAKYGTPCYVYSQQTILQNYQAYLRPFKASNQSFKIYYAVKANSNLHLLRLLANQGCGFDVVSGGEIARVLAAGGDPQNIVFAGVGKSALEISYALDVAIYAIHVESEAELLRIQEIAKAKNTLARIAIRVNPNVKSSTHSYISTGGQDNKFGIDYARALDIYLLAKSLPNIEIKGIATHIGSQITKLDPFLQSIDQLFLIIEQLKAHGIHLEYIDIGGGLGITYNDEVPPSIQDYVQAVTAKLQGSNLEIHVEPGRSMVANAGLLLTKVEYLKTTAHNNFAIVDAAMNDLIRPALYESYHGVLPVTISTNQAKQYSVVGPVCESGDFLALHRDLNIQAGDLLALKDTGAYGFSMSSNYNTRPRCAEVLVNGANVQLIRRRETIDQLLENELQLNLAHI